MFLKIHSLFQLSFSLFIASIAHAEMLFLEEFDPSTANQYTRTDTTGGSTFQERNSDIDLTGNSFGVVFDASDFTNGTFAYSSKANRITTDSISWAGYQYNSLEISIQLAGSLGWDAADDVRLEIRNAAGDSVLSTLDIYTAGNSSPLVAYSGSPYAGGASASTINATPQTLSYSLRDYLAEGSFPESFRVSFVSGGGTKNGSEDTAIGNISVSAVAVPEPSSILLMGLAALCGAIVLRRKG